MNPELAQSLGQMAPTDPDPRDSMFRNTSITPQSAQSTQAADPISGSAVKEEVDQNHASKDPNSQEAVEKQRKVDALSPKGI